MLIITGTIKAESLEEIERFKSALIRRAQRSREDKGCLDYAFAVSLENSREIRLIEKWANEEALKAHLETPDPEFDELIKTARIKKASIVAGEVGEEKQLMSR